MPNHETSSGFAVGTGNADDFELFCRMVVFGGSDDSLSPVVGKDGLIIKWEFFE